MSSKKARKLRSLRNRTECIQYIIFVLHGGIHLAGAKKDKKIHAGFFPLGLLGHSGPRILHFVGPRPP